MSLHKAHEESNYLSDVNIEDSEESLLHKKRVRRLLEERLERKRLKAELEDEFDDEFDWEQVDNNDD